MQEELLIEARKIELVWKQLTEQITDEEMDELRELYAVEQIAKAS